MAYTNITNPLDFERIISYTIGDTTLFLYIGLIVLAGLAAKIRMPVSSFMMLLLVYLIIMYMTLGSTIVILIAIILAIVSYLILAKVIKQ